MRLRAKVATTQFTDLRVVFSTCGLTAHQQQIRCEDVIKRQLKTCIRDFRCVVVCVEPKLSIMFRRPMCSHYRKCFCRSCYHVRNCVYCQRSEIALVFARLFNNRAKLVLCVAQVLCYLLQLTALQLARLLMSLLLRLLLKFAVVLLVLSTCCCCVLRFV